MRILYVNKYNYLKGGAERVLITEMQMMKSRGHEVAIFASRHPDNFPSEYSEQFVEEENYFNAGLAHKVKAAFKIIYSYEALKKFGRVIDLFGPNLIHAHNIYGQLSTGILDAAKKRRVPVVLTAHDYKLVCPSYMMLDHGKICEKCIGGSYYHCFTTSCHKENRAASAVYTAETYFNAWFKKYDSVRKFICPSRFMMSKIANRFPEDRIMVLNNPVDVSTYAPSSKDEGYYLYTGRISKEKGIITMIKAFAEMNLPLKIAGTGPLEEECRRLVGGTRIQMMGYRTGKELEELYQNAHACVVPSEWYENAPMSVIEPLAYGKPVIAARIGGIPEMIHEGQSGLLYKSFDSEDLKGKVREMEKLSPEDYGSMSRQARKSAEIQFSLEGHYDGLLKIYQQVFQPV